MRIQPIILAGGEGRRLAPLSTPSRPKPFVLLPDGQSLFEKTCRRLKHAMFLSPIIVGHQQHRYALMNHARAAGVTPSAILLEDETRNTAFAVAAAVHFVNLTRPGATLLFLPADHVVADINAWREAITRAYGLAHTHDALALVGTEGEEASSEFGYMQIKGDKVTQFVEKPDFPEKLIESGVWSVNSGQFLGTSRRFSAEIAKNAPKIWTVSSESVQNRQKIWEYDCLDPIKQPYTPISFDHAVLEHSQNIVAARAHYGWQDLGTLEKWLGYTKLSMEIQLVRYDRIDRPWGFYEILEHLPDQTTKRLHVFPGCRLSRQRHFHRSEHWAVESGTAYVEKNDEKITLDIYESIKIPPASWHRLVNPTSEMLIIKEIQYGIADEMDIERDEDDYGRI